MEKLPYQQLKAKFQSLSTKEQNAPKPFLNKWLAEHGWTYEEAVIAIHEDTAAQQAIIAAKQAAKQAAEDAAHKIEVDAYKKVLEIRLAGGTCPDEWEANAKL